MKTSNWRNAGFFDGGQRRAQHLVGSDHAGRSDAQEASVRDRIVSVVDSLVRDAKGHQAYRMSA